MRFNIPLSHSHSQMRLTVRATGWGTDCSFDDTHDFCEVEIPPHIKEADVEAFVEYLNGSGHVDPDKSAAVLKTKARVKLPPRINP